MVTDAVGLRFWLNSLDVPSCLLVDNLTALADGRAISDVVAHTLTAAGQADMAADTGAAAATPTAAGRVEAAIRLLGRAYGYGKLPAQLSRPCAAAKAVAAGDLPTICSMLQYLRSCAEGRTPPVMLAAGAAAAAAATTAAASSIATAAAAAAVATSASAVGSDVAAARAAQQPGLLEVEAAAAVGVAGGRSPSPLPPQVTAAAAAAPSPSREAASVVRNLSASLTQHAALAARDDGAASGGGAGGGASHPAASMRAGGAAQQAQQGGVHGSPPRSPGDRHRAARSPEHKLLRSSPSRFRVSEETTVVHREIAGVWVPCLAGGRAGGGDDAWPGAGVREAARLASPQRRRGAAAAATAAAAAPRHRAAPPQRMQSPPRSQRRRAPPAPPHQKTPVGRKSKGGFGMSIVGIGSDAYDFFHQHEQQRVLLLAATAGKSPAARRRGTGNVFGKTPTRG